MEYIKNKIQIEVNSNFHHIAGEDILTREDNLFREYREKWQEWPEKFYVGEFPLFIDIEVTSVCNLKCNFCATTFRSEFIKKGFMSFDIYKKIIDEGKDNNLYGVKLSMRGEPLLHPEIKKFVVYAKKNGLIDVYFNTNALLLNDEMSRKLIDAGLDRISISFEGSTKEIYERYRIGSDYEIVLKNIENLKKLKKKLSVAHPKIRIQTVRFSDIDLVDYKNFWVNLVDEVAFLDYKNVREKRKRIQFPWACPQLWQRMAVWWDGTILPCNHDDDGLLSLGNVGEVSLKDIWDSQVLNKIRQLHEKGMAHKISACDGCYLRDSEILKLQNKNE